MGIETKVTDLRNNVPLKSEETSSRLGWRVLTNLAASTEWFRDKSSQETIFKEFIEPYRLNVLQRAWNLSTNNYSIDREVPCMLIATIGWDDRKGQWPVSKIKSEVFQKFRQAREMNFANTYASDVVAIAQSNEISVREVVDAVNRIKSDERYIKAGGKLWSTATTLASIHFATGLTIDESVSKFLEINDQTGRSEQDVTLCALTQASLLGDQKTVLDRFKTLKEKVLLKEKWPKKNDQVSIGSKAFLVLAETIGGFSTGESEEAVKTLMTQHGLQQDTAVRYVLALANQKSETPVLCREGTYEKGEYAYIPTGKGAILIGPDIIPYSAAIRLGNRK